MNDLQSKRTRDSMSQSEIDDAVKQGKQLYQVVTTSQFADKTYGPFNNSVWDNLNDAQLHLQFLNSLNQINNYDKSNNHYNHNHYHNIRTYQP